MCLKQMLCACVTVFMALPASADRLTIFAAASLNAPLMAILLDADIQADVSFAGSSTLARQIAFGAPADVFLSASVDWAHYVMVQRGDVARSAVFASNTLVLAGYGAPIALDVDGLSQARQMGRIAVPLMDAVPLGQYTKQALDNLDLLTDIQPFLAQTDNAATARALLTKGAVQAAFLYASDLHNTDLRIMANIPSNAHTPIQYVAVALTPGGDPFVQMLRDSAAQTILQTQGFTRVD